MSYTLTYSGAEVQSKLDLVGTHETEITSLQSTVDSHTTDISDLETDVGNLQNIPIRLVSASDHTLELSDAGKLIRMRSSNLRTLNIPTNASVPFPIGTQIAVIRAGTNEVTIAGAGVTINSAGGKTRIYAQYDSVALIKYGTDLWYLVGALK